MLYLCSACQRHIKAETCPFCGASDPVATVTVGRARRHGMPLLAGAVAGAVALSACSTSLYGAPGDDDDTTSSSSGSNVRDAGEDG